MLRNGNELAVRRPLGLPTMAMDPFGFNARSGYTFDRELGTYSCQNRTDDPGTARWLERDPIGFAGGINPYSYCAAQPMGNVDPSGTMISVGLVAGPSMQPEGPPSEADRKTQSFKVELDSPKVLEFPATIISTITIVQTELAEPIILVMTTLYPSEMGYFLQVRFRALPLEGEFPGDH